MATQPQLDTNVQQPLQRGVAIPAHPLALDSQRRLDERRQRALSRYYLDSGAGGLAVGVHTTQFSIRNKEVGLFEPVLELAREEMDRVDAKRDEPVIRIGGACGQTDQAVTEAELLRDKGYHAALVSLAALGDRDEDALVNHCRRVSEVLPIIGFYLQTAVGGQVLPFSFWRRVAELPNLKAIKIAPFDRYKTLDVVRAVVESGRDDIALYTGNDDHIVGDLLTTWQLDENRPDTRRGIVGGLLGHWSVWTRRAVELLERCHKTVQTPEQMDLSMLTLAEQITDTNAAFFDAANNFTGVIAGIHEVLRRQGLLEGIWCLDPNETLGPGQAGEIDRVYAAYPHLHDDAFVAENRDRWLSG